MRRATAIRRKLKQYTEALEEIARAGLSSDEYMKATMYQRGIVNTLRWVLGELEDV